MDKGRLDWDNTDSDNEIFDFGVNSYDFFVFERELCEHVSKEVLDSVTELIKIMIIVTTPEWHPYLALVGYCHSENSSDISNGNNDDSDNDRNNSSPIWSESVDSDNDSDSPIWSENVDSDNDSDSFIWSESVDNDSDSPIWSENVDSDNDSDSFIWSESGDSDNDSDSPIWSESGDSDNDSDSPIWSESVDSDNDSDSLIWSENVDSDNDSDSPIWSENVDSDNDSDSSIWSESGDSNQSESSSITTSTSQDDDINPTKNYSHLWVQCENCYGLNYKRLFMEKLYICEFCDFCVKMRSSDRIELSIDPGTWEPMDEDMVSLDPIEFYFDDEPYTDRIDSYQRETGLTEAVQTGLGEINGLPIAMAVMDFQFIGGSMGSVVGEKITRLIEYATKKSLPLIIVCASGGARMQEGSLSLIQMAKISSASYNYQIIHKLFYVSILTSPTTGGVTASFGMLGDIIISEPNAYIAFAGKRVIEQTLNLTLPDGSQEAEYLFHNGLLDPIVPRDFLKDVLIELFHIHGLFPLTQNSIK